jgi:hypothetical protein
VCPGWWIGGCYAHKLKRKWAVTIDLTVEFPERCIGTTAHYLNLPCWDGQPPKVEEIEAAAQLAARYRNEVKPNKRLALPSNLPNQPPAPTHH